jgi:hypothetical protein
MVGTCGIVLESFAPEPDMTRRSYATPYATKSGPRSSAILAAAIVMAVALPVAVVLPRESELPTVVNARSDLAIPAAAIQPTALPPAAIHMTPAAGEWTESASQSAYMVLVGSLLIGIGSFVRRAA